MKNYDWFDYTVNCIDIIKCYFRQCGNRRDFHERRETEEAYRGRQQKSYQADKADGTACQIPGYHTGSDHAGRLPEQCFCRRLFCGSSCRLVYRSWGTYSQNCVKFCCRYYHYRDSFLF